MSTTEKIWIKRRTCYLHARQILRLFLHKKQIESISVTLLHAKSRDFTILEITLSDQQSTDINIFRANLFRPTKFRTILISDLLIFGEMANKRFQDGPRFEVSLYPNFINFDPFLPLVLSGVLSFLVGVGYNRSIFQIMLTISLKDDQ